MKISKEDYFLNNPFSIKVMKEFSDLTRDVRQRPGFSFDQNNHHLLSSTEKYLNNIFSKQGSLQALSKQLGDVRVYLQRYPLKDYYKGNNIDQFDYIQYHLEAIYHKISTIEDVMKLMVNEVYQLNIPDGRCSWNSLCKKMDKNIAGMICISYYHTNFDRIINFRNLNTHRGYFKDPKRDYIERDLGYLMYRLESKYLPVTDELRNDYPLHYINKSIREYRKEKIDLVDDIIQANNQLLKQFLNSLLVPLDENLAKFKDIVPE